MATRKFLANIDIDGGLKVGTLSGVLKASGGTISGSAAHSDLTGLTSGDPHTQYISTAPSSSSRNIIDAGAFSDKVLLKLYGYQGLGGPTNNFIEIYSDAGTTKIVYIDHSGKGFFKGLDAGSLKITNVGTPTSSGDAVNLSYLQTGYVVHGINTTNLVGKYIDARTHGILTGAGSTAAAPSADRLIAYPIWITNTDTFDRIGINVTTGGGLGASCSIGIYEDDGGKPGNLVVDSGSLDVSTSGGKEVAISITLTGGKVYWLAFHQPNTSTSTRYFGYSYGGGRCLYYDNLTDTSIHRAAIYRTLTYTGSLPNPFGTVSGLDVTFPNIRLRVS